MYNHSYCFFSIELLAIRHALAWILKNTPDTRPYLILSNCLSGLESIKKFEYRYDQEVVEYIVLILNQIKEKGVDVILAWIPGHVGIVGNEDVDKIARNAATSETTSIQNFAISKTEAKTTIKQY